MGMSLALVVLVGLIGLVVLLTAIGTSRRQQRKLLRAPVAPLAVKRDALLSPAERSYLGVLEPIATELGLHISCKTRLVLCAQSTMEPVLAIELDDPSHDRADRQRRDRLVDEICASADLPILYVQARRGFPVGEVRHQVMRALTKANAARASAA